MAPRHPARRNRFGTADGIVPIVVRITDRPFSIPTGLCFPRGTGARTLGRFIARFTSGNRIVLGVFDGGTLKRPKVLGITHIFFRFTRQNLPGTTISTLAHSEAMHSTLLQPQEWAQLEFSSAEFGDARRTNRLVKVGAALAQCATGTLPQALPEWAELKAAYRLFDNPNVNFEKILEPHWQRTRQSCTEPGEYLFIEDTTALDYSTHRGCADLGQVGNQHGRGLSLHSTLALRVNAWDLNHCPEVEVVGVIGQKCWARRGPSRRKSKEKWRQRFKRERESQRWTESLSQMPERPEGAIWIYLADRESDIYEAFDNCRK